MTDGRSSDDYRMPQEDVRVSLMWGSQVLQRIAQQVRESENKLVMAEKAGVIANLANGYRYGQATLDEGWRTLMLAQHHDSWIVPYNGLNKQGTWAQHIRRWTAATDSLCDGVIADALQSFAGTGRRRAWRSACASATRSAAPAAKRCRRRCPKASATGS